MLLLVGRWTYVANSSVLTGVNNTLIDVSGTDISSPAGSTCTSEGVKSILPMMTEMNNCLFFRLSTYSTSGPILAVVFFAFINFHCAVWAGPAIGAEAVELSNIILHITEY